jgi:hypothetical protein
LASAGAGEKRKGYSAAPGRAFFWFLFFARAKKRNLPWVSHPQVIRRRRRHNEKAAQRAAFVIQTLDSRLRGNDGLNETSFAELMVGGKIIYCLTSIPFTS